MVSFLAHPVFKIWKHSSGTRMPMLRLREANTLTHMQFFSKYRPQPGSMSTNTGYVYVRIGLTDRKTDDGYAVRKC